ncbi:protein MMS22-like isoform X2 [Pecten maximus]|uniref:protein MMS22-like isoform X2 n=1 Tax=Pecten maximus TaxID=6579 RepID=UPI00145900BC|nr:protein MMS22-like isoform X2 [Pecten maximus]
MDENSITPPLSPDNPYRLDIEDSDMMFADDMTRQFPSTPVHFPDEGQLMDVQEQPPTYTNQRPFTCHKSAPKQLESFLKTIESAYVPDLDSIVELFNHQFVTCQLEQTLNKLFLFLSQWICRLQNRNPSPVSEVRRWRQDIISFYIFLKSYVLRYKVCDEPPLLNSLLTLMHSTILYVDAPTKIHYDSMSRMDGCEYNSFHLCLDVYWETLELLCLLEYKFQVLPCRRSLFRCSQREDEDHKSMFTQMVELILWELVTLAQQVYSKISIKEALEKSPFLCPCVKEMWIMCEVLLRHKHGSEQLFWFHINNMMRVLQEDEVPENNNNMEIDSDVCVYPATSPIIKDKTGFCLWLSTKLAVLQTDSSNSCSVQHTSDSNYQEVMAALRKSLAKTDLSESDVRFYLQCCVNLAEHWKPNVTLLLLLWDHFYRKMNSSFLLNVATVDGLGTISKSSLTLLEQCNRLGCGQYKFKPQDTSFQLFLGLLGNHLHQMLDSGSNQEWRQIKGRVYSKFHKRRIQELTENGFYNFTSLFLCLSLAADTEDVTGKLCDFYNMVDVSSLSLNTTRVVWMGMFAMVHLHQQKDLDFSFLTERLGQAFNNTSLELMCDDLDPRRRQLLWKLILFYIESLQEVFESSSKLGPGHSKLIKGFANVLRVCRSNEMGPVLGTIEAVITRIREMKKKPGAEKNIEDLYRVLWTVVLPTVKTLSCSQTASPLLADTLAGITLLAFDSKKEDFISMVKFVQSGATNRSVCCRFWSHLLPTDSVLTTLSSLVPNYQTDLIQTWVSSTVFLPAQSTHLLTMNRCMQTLPEVLEIMTQAGVNKSEASCLHFIKAVDIVYNKTMVWKDRIQLRDKAMNYFSHVLRQLSPILQSLKPVETLANAYAVMGYIVKCCAQLLFVQAKPDCPLPNIISAMVVPHFLFNSDKPVSPVFLAVARDHLHLFVRGLGRLDYRKAPYVQRRLKDIVAIYIPKFWTSSCSLSSGTASSVHPLVVSLKDSCVRQPTESAMEFRQFIFEAVIEKFLVPSHFTLPPNHHLALMFLREIIGRTYSKEAAVRDASTVLGGVLTVMVLSEVQTTYLCAQTIATKLLEDCKASATSTLASVTKTLETFVTIHKKTHLDHCIRALDKLSKAGGIFISHILPKLQHFIVDHESHRGVGSDSKLRQNYTNLSRNVSCNQRNDT